MGALATIQDIKKEVLHRCGELEDGSSEYDSKVVDYIDRWHRQILAGSTELDVDCGDAWYWARSEFPGVMNLNPFIDGDGLTITYGSTSGTFNTPPQIAGNNVSVKNWYIRMSGYPDFYRVVSHTAGQTAFTLDGGFTETPVTPGLIPYMAYQLDYQLPSSVLRVVAPMLVYRRQTPYADDSGQIDGIDKMSMNRDYPLLRILQGVPDRFAVTYQDSNGIKVHFNRVSPFATRVEYDYIPNPLNMHGTLSGSISAVADNGTTLARFTTTSAHGLQVGDSVVISNAGAYTGVAVVTLIPSTTTFDTAQSFGVTQTGSFTCDIAPLIPQPQRIVLVHCASYSLLMDKNDNRAAEYKTVASASLMALVKANRRSKAIIQKDMGRLISRRDMTHYARRYYAQEVSQ